MYSRRVKSAGSDPPPTGLSGTVAEVTRSGSGKPLKEGSDEWRFDWSGLVRQGDLLLVPVSELPEYAPKLRSGRLVLLRGEATGHAHVIEDERASLHGWSSERYLCVEGAGPVSLVHEEHDPLPIVPGLYEVRRQREYVPQQRTRWVAD